MKNFLSFSSNPGTTGLKYYSHFFKKYNLDYTYTPLAIDNLEQSIDLAKEQGIIGMSISMPFKNSIIQYLDQYDNLVEQYKSCNTVIIENNKLVGYNADYYGALAIKKFIKETDDVIILGNGSMGRMIHQILDKSFLVSRSLGNWNHRHKKVNVVINCTALGTASMESPFDCIPDVDLVIDLALKDNNLKLQCYQKKIKYVSGIAFYKFNFLRQFEIYTGIKINEDEFEEL